MKAIQTALALELNQLGEARQPCYIVLKHGYCQRVGQKAVVCQLKGVACLILAALTMPELQQQLAEAVKGARSAMARAFDNISIGSFKMQAN